MTGEGEDCISAGEGTVDRCRQTDSFSVQVQAHT